MNDIRTLYRAGDLLFVSNGPPSEEASFAICPDGVVLSAGEANRPVIPWRDLVSIDFRLKGVRRASSPLLVLILLRAAGVIYAVAAAVLFAVTFGGLGGAPFKLPSDLEVQPFLRGRPRAFAELFVIPVAWPRHPTHLELQWFSAIVDRLCGESATLQMEGLVDLLDRAGGVDDLVSGLDELVVEA
jgi:hypothetical protein